VKYLYDFKGVESMVTIAMFVPKGGTGKTTITATLLSALNFNYPEKKSLAIDLVPAGHLTYHLYKNPDEIELTESIHRMFYDDQYKISDLCHNSRLKNVDIIPSTLPLERLDKKQGSSSHTMIKKHLEKTGNKYDYVFLDMPTTFSFYSVNALAAADYLLIPILLETFSVRAIPDAFYFYENAKIENPNLKILGILPNRYNKNMEFHNKTLDELKKSEYKDYLLEDFIISENKNIIKALMNQKTLFEIGKKNTGHKEFKKLLDWIINECSEIPLEKNK